MWQSVCYMVVPVAALGTQDLIALASAILTAVGLTAGGTCWLMSSLQAGRDKSAALEVEALRARKEEDLKRLEERVAQERLDFTTRLEYEQNLNGQLEKQLDAFREKMGSALVLRDRISSELNTLARQLNVPLASVYVEAPGGHQGLSSGYLVFLCTFGATRHSLRWSRIPKDDTEAGRAFESGLPRIQLRMPDPSSYSKTMDKVSGVQTQNMLSYPLVVASRVVGVVQFLNRSLEAPFTDRDTEMLAHNGTNLAALVAEFVGNPANLTILPGNEPASGVRGTALFCDLSASSVLFERQGASLAISLINRYLDEASTIAMRFGGVVDTYLGDGALIKFNLPRPVRDYQHQAVLASIEIQRAFLAMKAEWTRSGYEVGELNSRIGIATGDIFPALVGSPHSQHFTVLGTTVNLASALCEQAPRGRAVIAIDRVTEIPPGFEVHARSVAAEVKGELPRSYGTLLEVS